MAFAAHASESRPCLPQALARPADLAADHARSAAALAGDREPGHEFDHVLTELSDQCLTQFLGRSSRPWEREIKGVTVEGVGEPPLHDEVFPGVLIQPGQVREAPVGYVQTSTSKPRTGRWFGGCEPLGLPFIKGMKPTSVRVPDSGLAIPPIEPLTEGEATVRAESTPIGLPTNGTRPGSADPLGGGEAAHRVAPRSALSTIVARRAMTPGSLIDSGRPCSARVRATISEMTAGSNWERDAGPLAILPAKEGLPLEAVGLRPQFRFPSSPHA